MFRMKAFSHRVFIGSLILFYTAVSDGFNPNYQPTTKISIHDLNLFRKNLTGVLSIAFACSFCYPNIVNAISTTVHSNIEQQQHQQAIEPEELFWLLPNDKVQISNPLTSFPQQILRNPKLLGSGGGGAVFSLQQEQQQIGQYSESDNGDNKKKREVAVKISWVASAKSVERECKILNQLEEKHTRNVEHCLGMVDYPFDHRRVMIALQPVVHDATASIAELEDKSKQIDCSKSVMRTLVDMLASNVVTTDVQVLIDKGTGKITFIDMTEAQIMSKPPTFLDMAQASSFCAEMFALIPENLLSTAVMTLEDELKSGVQFSDQQLYDMLKNAIDSYSK